MIPLNEMVETFIGEIPVIGQPCVLVRIAGCNLDCDWCDTDKEHISERITVDELYNRIMDTDREWVLITGGEPMLCARTAELIEKLIESNRKIVLETNGSIPLDSVPKEIVKSVDIKTPSSGHAGCFLESNLRYIDKIDCVKFVIANRQDFDWALGEIDRFNLFKIGQVVFSPVWDRMQASKLSEWILQTGLPIRLSIQIHKIIGIK